MRNFAADHRLDQVVFGERRRLVRLRHAAVLEDDRFVAYLENFIHPVRDQNERRSFGLQLAHHSEQPLRFRLGQARGRFVQNKHGRTGQPGLRDFNHLLFGRRQVLDQPVRVHLEADFLQHFARPLVQLPVADQAEAGRLPAEQHIFADRQLRQQAQLLVNDRDAHPLGGLRISERDLLSLVGDRSAVGRKTSGQNVHQGAFARAVLADQRQNGPSLASDGHVLQHRVAEKALRQSGSLQNDFGLLYGFHGSDLHTRDVIR